jgi:hypothetical protein
VLAELALQANRDAQRQGDADIEQKGAVHASSNRTVSIILPPAFEPDLETGGCCHAARRFAPLFAL